MRPECTLPGYEENSTMIPTEVGEPVRFVAYGGDVRQWTMEYDGVVVRFNRNGHPVVRVEAPSQTGQPSSEVTDRFGCARVIDASGALVRAGSVA